MNQCLTCQENYLLLAVLCCHRAREILGAIDLKNISFGQNLFIIRTGDVFKTATRTFHSGELKFLTYHENCICPLETDYC